MYWPDYRRYAILPSSRLRLKSEPRVQKRREDTSTGKRYFFLRTRVREKGLRAIYIYLFVTMLLILEKCREIFVRLYAINYVCNSKLNC